METEGSLAPTPPAAGVLAPEAGEVERARRSLMVDSSAGPSLAVDRVSEERIAEAEKDCSKGLGSVSKVLLKKCEDLFADSEGGGSEAARVEREGAVAHTHISLAMNSML